MNRKERLKKEIDSISDGNTNLDYGLAIDILTHRVMDDVRSLAKEVLQEILDGDLEADDRADYIDQCVDGYLMYTKDQYLYAWLLRDSDDFEELYGRTGDWDKMLGVKAYCNLRDEVRSMVEHCLSEADWETEDEEEEP